MLGPQNKAVRLPRQTVRENANLFMLYRQDAKNLSHIYRDHAFDVPFDQFSKFCTDVWSAGKHNFVTIDTTSQPCCGKYRRNLDEYWINKEE